MASVTVILVAYNSAAVIGSALRSVVANPEVARVIVVDNHSADGTAALVRQEYPSVEIIESGENLGFGRGNNLGLARVQTPFALLMNPDAVLHGGAIAALLQAAQDFPEACILAPALIDNLGRMHETIKRSVFVRERDGGVFILPEGPCSAEFLSGAVWLLRMAPFQEHGYFDPGIFLYYEDDDLCLKARKLGGCCVFVPSASALHLLGKSTAPSAAGEYFRHQHMAWSRLYMEEKYNGAAAMRALALRQRLFILAKLGWYGLTFNTRKSARYRGKWRGIAAYLSGIPSTPALR